MKRFSHERITEFSDFFVNIIKNLDPRYLFISGDINLRHSTQMVGQWSWVDILAVVFGLVWIAYNKWRKRPVGLPWLGFFAASYLFGIFPAAMNQGFAHSVRSVGCWPFLALASGLLLWRLTEIKNIFKPVVTVVAVAFSCFFLNDYFSAYPARSIGWFDADLKYLAQASKDHSDWTKYIILTRPLIQPTRTYYLMTYGGYSCADARNMITADH
jgi:hypothetical protein